MSKKVYQIADNIISVFGFSTQEAVVALEAGRSGLSTCTRYQVAESVLASQINRAYLNEKFHQAFGEQNTFEGTPLTDFEKMCILCVKLALKKCQVNAADKRTLFVLSTTKGNVELLNAKIGANFAPEQLFLWHTAEKIAHFFANQNTPVVVSNACISGVSAQIMAKRYLLADLYDTVIVIGCDCLSQFIISGFQSFKALSPVACRPFDIDRIGLNLGEAAACLILGAKDETELQPNDIFYQTDAITNDANHISGPSRTGEGLYQAILQAISEHKPDFINTHGTATLYNDEMESIALFRSKLTDCPTFSLKGYFGHTLGAAGILETIISSHALQQNRLIRSAGYENCGVSHPLNIVRETKMTNLRRFLKTISGFGGCNATLLIEKK